MITSADCTLWDTFVCFACGWLEKLERKVLGCFPTLSKTGVVLCGGGGGQESC